MLYILSGPDDFSRTQALNEIKLSLGDPATLDNSTTILEGQKVTLEELKHACETIPFLSEKRLVIIYGLIERFEPSSKTERGRASSQRSAPDPGPFIDCLENIPESTIAVLVEDGLPNSPRKDGLLKSISGKADLKSFPLVKDEKLRSWIRDRVSKLGGHISPPAVETLFQLVGSNLWIMASELDKLLLYASGRSIEEADVHALVGYTQDVSVFAMIDAIVDFKVEQAGQTLQQLLGQGAAPAYLLFMLDRQFRMIVRAKAMKAQGKTDGYIQSKLGIYNEFAMRRTLAQARRYTSARLEQIYQSLLETDLSIKTGRYDNELALNLLVAELCRRGNPSSEKTGDRYADS